MTTKSRGSFPLVAIASVGCAIAVGLAAGWTYPKPSSSGSISATESAAASASAAPPTPAPEREATADTIHPSFLPGTEASFDRWLRGGETTASGLRAEPPHAIARIGLTPRASFEPAWAATPRIAAPQSIVRVGPGGGLSHVGDPKGTGAHAGGISGDSSLHQVDLP